MSDYTWVTEPPVRAVSPEAVGGSVKQFKEAVESYGPVPGDPSTEEDPEGRPDLSERMNQHKGDALSIARIIDNSDWYSKALPVFEYTLAGEPLALMQLKTNGGILEITNMASHPGTTMAGGIMVEYALNKIAHFNSDREDKQLPEGEIGLYSMNPRSTAAWRALGFVPVDKKADVTGHLHPIPMVLDANNSPTWQKLDNKWRHARYATTTTHYLNKTI